MRQKSVSFEATVLEAFASLNVDLTIGPITTDTNGTQLHTGDVAGDVTPRAASDVGRRAAVDGRRKTTPNAGSVTEGWFECWSVLRPRALKFLVQIWIRFSSRPNVDLYCFRYSTTM